MKNRNRPKQSTSPSSSPVPNGPRPLAVGEFVFCTKLPDSSSDPIVAEVVALDDVYSNAAAEYLASSPATRDDTSIAATVDLTRIDPLNTPAASGLRGLNKISSKLQGIDLKSPSVKSSAPPESNGLSPTDPLKSGKSSKRNSKSLPENPIYLGKVYIHFPRHDHRLDRWVNASKLQRAPPPDEIAGEESDSQPRKMTRAMKRAHDEVNPSADADIAMDGCTPAEAAALEKHATVVRNIATLVLGDYLIDAWYCSRMPTKYNKIDTLYVCGNCLKYEASNVSYDAHRRKCQVISPPGELVYADNKKHVRVYEVDGAFSSLYCCRLSRIAKLFLEHKTICYDISAFLFYVMTMRQEIVGYFSKEKAMTNSRYNVACILTFPQHQRKGVGRFLIDFSYELTCREGKVGSPERPLSDLGQVSYRKHWNHAIVKYLRQHQAGNQSVPLNEIMTATGICEKDLVDSLKLLKLTHMFKGEYFADASVKLLEAVEQKVSEPPIPALAKNFLGRWANNSSAVNTPEITTPRPPTTSNGKQRTPPNDTVRISKSSVARTPNGTVAKSNSQAKKRPAKKKNGKTHHQSSKKLSDATAHNSTIGKKEDEIHANVYCTDYALARMDSFIELHSAEACSLDTNEKGGIEINEWKRLAGLVGHSVSTVQQKVQTKARQICARGARLHNRLRRSTTVDVLSTMGSKTSEPPRKIDTSSKDNGKTGESGNINMGDVASHCVTPSSGKDELLEIVGQNGNYDSDDEDDFQEQVPMNQYDVERGMMQFTRSVSEGNDRQQRSGGNRSGRVEFVEAKNDRQESSVEGADIVIID